MEVGTFDWEGSNNSWLLTLKRFGEKSNSLVLMSLDSQHLKTLLCPPEDCWKPQEQVTKDAFVTGQVVRAELFQA